MTRDELDRSLDRVTAWLYRECPAPVGDDLAQALWRLVTVGRERLRDERAKRPDPTDPLNLEGRHDDEGRQGA